MRDKFAFVFAICIAAGSQTALAESTTIDLDTAPGNFSVWKVSELTASAVAFEATYLDIKKHDQWAPTYAIKLSDGQAQRIVFSGSYQGGDVPKTKTSVSKDGMDVAAADSILAFNLKQTYKVRLAWTDGKVTVTIDGDSREYALPFKPSEIQISCSTGELEVKNITFSNQPG